MVSKFIVILVVIAVVTILAVAVMYMADQGVFTPPAPTPTPIPTATPVPTATPIPTVSPTSEPTPIETITNNTSVVVTVTPSPESSRTPTSTPQPTGKITTYHLGDEILRDWSHYFYFHGWTHVYQNGDWLLIGHYYYDSMSNMEFELDKGMTFHLRSYEYKVVDYGVDWIQLIEVK